MFDEFWSAYPHKVGKDAARKAFDKRRVDRKTLDAMLASIAAQKRSRQWTEEKGRYIPHPSTWLNHGRWMDELPPQKPVSDIPMDWWTPAGFACEPEARNFGCTPSQYHLFRDGKRIEEVQA